MVFEWPIRVYIEDTDAGGIVYYANYLRFLERARSEWLRSLGFEQERLRQQDCLFVVHDVHIRYHRPAKLDDELLVQLRIERLRKTGMTLMQRIVRYDEHSQETEIVSAQVSIACVNELGKPTAMPDEMQAAMNQSLIGEPL